MTNPQIVCPNCKTQIPVTDALAEPLVADARRRFEQQLAAKEADFGRREAQLRHAQDELSKAREAVDDQVAAKLKAERSTITQAEAKKARLALADEISARDQQLADLQHILATNTEKLAAAQKAQAEMLRKERKLDDAKRELDLTVEKRVQDSLAGVRDKAKLEAEEALKSKVAEKEAQIAGMQRQIEDLKRKAEQGSQQLQGETSELELEALLRASFRNDLIEPVLSGHAGGDLLHRVLGPGGQVCGTILWESKRTKNWSNDWLSKVRNDQRAAKAEISLIVSSALPKGLETFDVIEYVWVAEPRFAIPLATVLRQWLIDLADSRTAQEGQQTKMELVYTYLTGPPLPPAHRCHRRTLHRHAEGSPPRAKDDDAALGEAPRATPWRARFNRRPLRRFARDRRQGDAGNREPGRADDRREGGSGGVDLTAKKDHCRALH